MVSVLDNFFGMILTGLAITGMAFMVLSAWQFEKSLFGGRPGYRWKSMLLGPFAPTGWFNDNAAAYRILAWKYFRYGFLIFCGIAACVLTRILLEVLLKQL